MGAVQKFVWNDTDWVQYGQRAVGITPTLICEV